jgi:hypothetical protein
MTNEYITTLYVKALERLSIFTGAEQHRLAAQIGQVNGVVQPLGSPASPFL